MERTMKEFFMNSNRNRIFLVLLLFSMVSFSSDDETINWSQTYKLKYADFKGQIPPKSKYSAETSAQRHFSYEMDANVFRYKMVSYFEKTNSWMKEDNGPLLIHEQGHFDICEIYSRKMREFFASLTVSTFNEDFIHKQFEKFVTEEEALDSVYDKQTNHGSDAAAQQVWNGRIQTMLDSLKEYDNPNGVVILNE